MLCKGPTAPVRALAVRVSQYLKAHPGVHSATAMGVAMSCARRDLIRPIEWLKGRGLLRRIGKGPGSGYEWTCRE